MSSGNAVQLPQWQSHKKVWGDKIINIVDAGKNEELVSADDTGERWILACGGRVVVTKELQRRGGVSPIGGYYVRYADNFESWSPAKAFEEGHTRI